MCPVLTLVDETNDERQPGAIHVELTPEEVEYLEEKYTPREVYGFQ